MHRPGAHLDVERLLQEAAARRPELGQLEDQLLERDHAYRLSAGRGASRARPERISAPSPDADAISRRWAVSSSRRRGGRQRQRCRACSGAAARRAARNCIASARGPSPRPDGAHRRHTNMCSRGGITAPAHERRRRSPAHVERRIDALQPQQPVLEVARQLVDRRARRQSRRPSTRPAGTAARRRAPPAPTRRSARRSSRRGPSASPRVAPASGDRTTARRS